MMEMAQIASETLF